MNKGLPQSSAGIHQNNFIKETESERDVGGVCQGAGLCHNTPLKRFEIHKLHQSLIITLDIYGFESWNTLTHKTLAFVRGNSLI